MLGRFDWIKRTASLAYAVDFVRMLNDNVPHMLSVCEGHSFYKGFLVMPKKVLIALPPAMLEQVDYIAQMEHRTRSDLIRESLRRYLDGFRRNQHVASSSLDLVPPTTVT